MTVPDESADGATVSGPFGSLETRERLTGEQIDGIARSPLAQLTLDEKIDMMSGGRDFFEGMLHFGSGGYKRLPVTTVGQIPRLGIAGLRFTDGPRGSCRVRNDLGGPPGPAGGGFWP